jgi:ATP-dependent Lon protease
MGYTTNESMVRVDRFKESGKWYDTLEVEMVDEYYDHWNIFEAVEKSIDAKYGVGYVMAWTNQGGSFVCLEPCHKHSHPVMLTQPRN